VVTVQQQPKLLWDYSSDCGSIEGQLLTMRPHGLTALLDAIPLAVKHLRMASNPRRAILIISDGGENSSRIRLSEIRQQVREANAQLYAATLGSDAEFDRLTGDVDGSRGPKLLAELAELTGGRALGIDDFQEIGKVAASLAREIHDQYVIGYQSPDPGTDGKYHRIVVKVSREPGTPRVSLFYRTSYQAPIQ
jgi:Ca-activated chloride channel family protein